VDEKDFAVKVYFSKKNLLRTPESEKYPNNPVILSKIREIRVIRGCKKIIFLLINRPFIV